MRIDAPRPAPALVTTVVDGHLVGLELRHVEGVARERSDTARRVELASVLGAGVPSTGRTLVAQAADGARWEIAVGGVRVLPADAARLLPLPLFIAGLVERAAICGLLVLEERIGFLVDAEQLVRLAEAGAPRAEAGLPPPGEAR